MEPRIGEVIYRARSYRRMSQASLASKCGVHMNSIREIENGVRSPRFSTLCKISEALEYELSSLVKKAETMDKAPITVQPIVNPLQ
jgi:transcriptional regulator with XRE-family HTH domain